MDTESPIPPTTPTPTSDTTPPPERASDVARWNTGQLGDLSPTTPPPGTAPAPLSDERRADLARWNSQATPTPPPTPAAVAPTTDPASTPFPQVDQSVDLTVTAPVTVRLRADDTVVAQPSAGEFRNADGKTVEQVKSEAAAAEAYRQAEIEANATSNLVRSANSRYPSDEGADVIPLGVVMEHGPVKLVDSLSNRLRELSDWHKSQGRLVERVRAQACADILDDTIVALARAESLEVPK